MQPRKRELISVVTPCFNEETNVGPCYEAVRELFQKALPGYDYEHVFCDNASTDDTVPKLRELAAADPRVRVILNSRNFGPSRSSYNGILAAQGDAVLAVLSADLQDPPELLVDFLAQRDRGYRVVYGIRAQRDETFVKRTVRRIYYRFMARMSDVKLPVDVGLFQLLDRSVIETLKQCDDYYPYVRGLVPHCGFSSIGVSYGMRRRERGISKTPWGSMLDQGMNGLVSFSGLPLRIGMLAGFVTAAAALLGGVALCGWQIVAQGNLAVPALPALALLMTCFFGITIGFVGLVGEYVAATHFQVRRRPLVVEQERINFGEAASGRTSAPTASERILRQDEGDAGSGKPERARRNGLISRVLSAWL